MNAMKLFTIKIGLFLFNRSISRSIMIFIFKFLISIVGLVKNRFIVMKMARVIKFLLAFLIRYKLIRSILRLKNSYR